ncbi:DUF819 domain-containing protein [Bacteroidales bacterium]
MNTTLLVITYLVTPAAILWMTARVPFLKKIGPVLLLYLVGILLGNSGLIPQGAYDLQDLIVTVIIPLAIPLMLFSCDFKRWDIKNAILTLITGTIAVVTAVLSGYYIFKPLIGSDPLMGAQMNKIAGMLAGVYTGGTPNLAAIKIMLGVPNETYLLIHSYDMAVSLLYLTFVLSIGIPLFRKVLHYPVRNGIPEKHMPVDSYDENPYKEFFKRENLLPLLCAFALSAGIFIIAGGLSLVLPKSIQMVVVILSITSLGIAASFVKRVREIKTSYDAGMYLVYIFSMVVASMADLTRLNLSGGIYLLLYITFAIFISLLIQLLLSKLFKLDADTVLISSVSLINSPPFVPLVAAAMKNKNVIITGLTVGLVGYAIGNYLGYIISLILS